MKLESNQQVFDIVVEHLAQQKIKSMSKGENDFGYRCKYRQQKGDTMLKCAIGCLIPDELYDESFDDSDGYTVDKLLKLQQFKYLKPYEALLIRLQGVHDYSDSIQDLKNLLFYNANYFGLNADKIDLITEWN